MRRRHLRRKTGTSIVETAVGLFVLIPVVLFLVDVAAAVLAQTANDAMCKHAARAAAEQTNAGQASSAAQAVVDAFPTSAIISAKQLINCDYVTNTRVTVITQITCTFPVPIPLGGPSTMNFRTDVTEPVVGTL